VITGQFINQRNITSSQGLCSTESVPFNITCTPASRLCCILLFMNWFKAVRTGYRTCVPLKAQKRKAVLLYKTKVCFKRLEATTAREYQGKCITHVSKRPCKWHNVIIVIQFCSSLECLPRVKVRVSLAPN
jgi:hypothetical protein